MKNINKNTTLNQFVELVEYNINRRLDYMPDDFNEQQMYAIGLFKTRVFLEEVIDETISFNKTINWNEKNENLKLTTNAEDLIEVFKLRSDVFHDIGYEKSFPDVMEGFNFDIFDKTSAIAFYKKDGEFRGTCRLIFDSINKLPSDTIHSFDSLRTKYNVIGEISRNVVKHRNKGLNLEFKYLMRAMCNLVIDNDIDLALSGIKKEHFKMFSRFGVVEVIKELNHYGTIEEPCLIMSYNPNTVSHFIKKTFLK
jgi:hypothetical protein